MGNQMNTRWGFVRKVCVLGLVASLWILLTLGVNYSVGISYHPDRTMIEIVAGYAWFLPPTLAAIFFGRILLHSPSIPIWFVQAAGAFSLLFLVMGAISRYFPALFISAVLVFM